MKNKNTISAILCILLMQITYSNDISPSLLVEKIIEQSPSTQLIPSEDIEKQRIQKDSLGAELRLKEILLSSDNEELKACYALSVVNWRIERIRQIDRREKLSNVKLSSMDIPSAIRSLNIQRRILIEYLHKVQKPKVEPVAGGDATR